MLKNIFLLSLLVLLTGCGVVKKDTVGSTDPVDYGPGTYIISQSETLSLKGNIDNRELGKGTVYYSENEEDGIYHLVASGVWTGELENSSVTFNPSGQHGVQVLDFGTGTSNWVICWSYHDENSIYHYPTDYDALTYNATTNTIDGLVGVTLNFTEASMLNNDSFIASGFHTAGESYFLITVKAYDSILNVRYIRFRFSKLTTSLWTWSIAGQGLTVLTGNIEVDSEGNTSGNLIVPISFIGLNGSDPLDCVVDLSEITFTNSDTNLYQGEIPYEGTDWEHLVYRYPDGREEHTYFKYYYDENDNKIRGETLDSNGKITFVSEYRVDGSEKYKAIYSNNGSSETWYDLNQRAIKIIRKDALGFFEEWFEYEYDSNGQLLSMIEKDEGGNVLREGIPATWDVDIICNLNSNSVIGDILSFNVDVYDSLGAKRVITITFELTDDWRWKWTASGSNSGGSGIIDFNSQGHVLDVSGSTVAVVGMNGSASMTVNFDFRYITSFPYQSYLNSYRHY